MTIKKLIDKYNADRKYYLTNKYNETLLRSDFLDPFFELLGWDIKNNAGKPTNEREVILEEALKENASEHSKKPDYTFRLFSERKLNSSLFFVKSSNFDKFTKPIFINLDLSFLKFLLKNIFPHLVITTKAVIQCYHF